MGYETQERSRPVEKVIQALKEYARRTRLGYVELFEARAEDFYKHTGFLAFLPPGFLAGKSEPLEMGGGEAYQEGRQQLWDKFKQWEREEYQRVIADAIGYLERGRAEQLTLPLRRVRPLI